VASDNVAQSTIALNLSRDEQAAIVEEVRAVLEAAPLVRPHTPGGAPMRVRVTSAGRLGWVGDGAYRYTDRDSRGRPWPAMPARWRAIADTVAGAHAWDSAIVNWYDEGASLGWHQDKNERDLTLPIVTISVGDSARWAVKSTRYRMGGDSGVVSRCTLLSGDVTLLAGPTRSYFHTIERVIPEPLFSPLPKRGRFSITIRVAGGAASSHTDGDHRGE
jgi:alkylated DNA repair protein (DNA oxidative demethylase)